MLLRDKNGRRLRKVRREDASGGSGRVRSDDREVQCAWRSLDAAQVYTNISYDLRQEGIVHAVLLNVARQSRYVV